jgi:hypothetical protein
MKHKLNNLDVQAHFPTTPPAPNTVEDGQLLIMLRITAGGVAIRCRGSCQP